jgi:DNA-binding NarL/FixJ family response regulator
VPTRFLLVDDHETFRLGMRLVVEGRAGGCVVGEAASVRQALRFLDGAEVDVVVLDVSMPGANGMSLLHELKRRRRREKVVVVTMHAHAELAAEAFAAGAIGFALKTDSAVALGEAVDTVTAGQRWVTPTLPLATIEAFLQQRVTGAGGGIFASLSVRERQVLELLVRDYSQQAIGDELCISPKTVDSHRAAIFRKLDVPSRFALLRLAFRHHLVDALDAVDAAVGE